MDLDVNFFLYKQKSLVCIVVSKNFIANFIQNNFCGKLTYVNEHF